MRTRVFAAIAALVVGCVSPAMSATVLNGSFEDIGSGSLNGRGWNHFAAIPGWTGLPNIEIQSNRTLRGIDAQEGDRYAELDTNGDFGISQDIFLTAGRYRLSFWYSPRVNDLQTSTNDMFYSVTDQISGTLTFGAVKGAPDPQFRHGEWTQITSNFSVAQDTRVELLFGASGGSRYRGCGNCGALIDNVDISAVPLPAGGLLLLGGLGAFAVMRSRKRQG